MTVALKGNTDPRQVFDSGDISVAAGEIQRTVKWEGIYADLEASIPASGDTWNEDTSYEVLTARLTRKRGTLGVLTIVYVKQSGLETIESASNLVIEIDWIREEMPFQLKMYVPGQDMADVMALIEDFVNERTASDRATIKADIIALGAVAERMLALRMCGITSYTIYRPIVRKTSDSILRPSILGTNLNKRQAPQIGTVSYPTSGDLNGAFTWTYIKEMDRASRTGRNKKWQRTEEWHGYVPPDDPDLVAAFNAMHPTA